MYEAFVCVILVNFKVYFCLHVRASKCRSVSGPPRIAKLTAGHHGLVCIIMIVCK